MNAGFLEGYLSRAQVRSYMEFIQESGVEAIVETRDGLYSDQANIGQMCAGAISSVKEFHISRFFSGENPKGIKQIKCVLVSDDSKPEVPENTSVIGIFYMSKLNRDFTAVDGYKGDVGDVLTLNPGDYAEHDFATTRTGTNNQLIVFWG